eukprot:scaffold19376_cov107-Cylindrotheca_fusiformis.AAC.1
MSVFAIRSCEGWSGPLIVFDQRDFERLQSSSSAAAAVEPSMSRTLEYRRFSDMKSAAQFLAETYESAFLEQMMVDSRPSNEPSSTKVATPATDSTGTKKRKIATPESSVAAAAPPTVGRIAGQAVPSTTKSPVAIAGSYNRKQWEEGFQQLFQYKVKHGHCNPSATTSADDETRKIAEWIGIQRRRQKGTSDHLEPLCEEDVRKLNAIGFDWRRPSRYLGSGGANSVLPCPSPWEENFQKLLLYKSKHGHCNPSSKSKDEATRKIGIWVGTQRRRQNGTSRSLKPLSEEEVRKLDAIGFDWRCPSKPKWDVRYQQLRMGIAKYQENMKRILHWDPGA